MGLPCPNRFPIPDPDPPAPREERPGGDRQEREPPSSALHYTTCSGTQCSPGPALPVTSPGEQEHPAPSLTSVSTGGGGGAAHPDPSRPSLSWPLPRAAGGASGHNPSRMHSTQPTALPSTCSIGWSRIVTQSCLPHLVLFSCPKETQHTQTPKTIKKKKKDPWGHGVSAFPFIYSKGAEGLLRACNCCWLTSPW